MFTVEKVKNDVRKKELWKGKWKGREEERGRDYIIQKEGEEEERSKNKD